MRDDRLRQRTVRRQPLCSPGKVIAFSAIPCEDQYREGRLHVADLWSLNERLKKRHERAGFPLVFAGVDVSLNPFDNSTSTRRWQLQVYGVVIGCTRSRSEPLCLDSTRRITARRGR